MHPIEASPKGASLLNISSIFQDISLVRRPRHVRLGGIWHLARYLRDRASGNYNNKQNNTQEIKKATSIIIYILELLELEKVKYVFL